MQLRCTDKQAVTVTVVAALAKAALQVAALLLVGQLFSTSAHVALWSSRNMHATHQTDVTDFEMS